MADLITTDQIQYWMKTATSTFTRVTESNAFDPSVDVTTYDPKYKDRMNQPSYVTGKVTTIALDIDLIDPGVLQQFLLDNEDTVNVETEIVRVMMFRPTLPVWEAATAYAEHDLIHMAGKIYEATTAGTSGAAESEPTWPASGTVTDGATLVWTYVSADTGYEDGPEGSYVAKKADFNLTQNPLDGPAGEAVRATGTLKMTSDGWTAGTFDPSTATFTPAA